MALMSDSGHKNHRGWSRGESGSALLLTLVVIFVLGVITVALSGFASTSLGTTRVYEDVRDLRYEADGAMKEAVNWIAHNDDVAIDPSAPTAGDCVYHSETVDSELVTVSCESDSEPGSGAGLPEDVGMSPPESILLLGDRHNEPGPYSFEKCDDIWDDLTRWFTGDTQGSSEKGLTAEKRKRATWGGLGNCEPRNRGAGPIRVDGDINIAGRLQLSDGFQLQVVGEGDDGGVVKVRYGCDDGDGNSTFSGAVVDVDNSDISDQVQCDIVSNPPRSDPGMPWDGKGIFSDPGRVSDSTFPIGDIESSFLPVGFDNDGTLSDGYTLPARTQAYYFDPDQNASGSADVPKNLVALPDVLNGSGACDIPSGTPVIFLWGLYSDVDDLNRYTAEPKCADRTFWFAPNPGPDRELLTDDDETAAFYLDFTETASKSKCGGMESQNPFRWCLGGADEDASSKPRIVVGWPTGWTALPEVDPDGSGSGSLGYGERVGVEMDTAGSVEGNFLTFWRNREDAATIDQKSATYEPCRWWIFTCPSFGQRSIRLAQLTPKVAGGPIAEVGHPNGRLYVDVQVAMNNASGTLPKVVVDYLDPNGDRVTTCGEFELNLDSVVKTHPAGDDVPPGSTATISDAQAEQLADNCGSVEAINNLRVTFKVERNVWNSPDLPTFDLDGVSVHYDSFQGASFPLPYHCEDTNVDGEIDDLDNCEVQAIGTDQPDDPAKSDCDSTRPGGQLIFGGSSHVYAADGSLEVCGGPDPDDPEGSMVIGIYGVPAVKPLRPQSFQISSAPGGNPGTTFTNTDRALRIGEPELAGAAKAELDFPGGCFALVIGGCWYGSFWTSDDNPNEKPKSLTFQFPAVAVPDGYKISSASLRASYTTAGTAWTTSAGNTGIVLEGCGSSDRIGVKDWYDTVRQWANDEALDILGPGSCVTADAIAGGLSGEWIPRVANGFTWGFNIDLNGFENFIEGVELDVEIVPDGSSVGAILKPQSGCITAHPNYDGGQGPDYADPNNIERINPDCAVVRADSYTEDDSTDGGLCLGTCPGRRTVWFGRVSVKGTIYAPSAAVEVDDNDIGYPLATRGVILRHLRFSGARPRSGFTDSLFGGDLDKSQAPRSAVLTACLQDDVSATSTRACDRAAGDRILARSGVRFEVAPATGSVIADVPRVEWYTDEATAGA